jgi:hypothetical protein
MIADAASLKGLRCLSQITSGHIDDEARPRSARK